MVLCGKKASRGSGICKLLHTLSPEDKRTLILAFAYQELRAELGEKGFFLFSRYDDSILNNKIFKTLGTIRAWLESQGFQIGWTFTSWFGYLRHVFEKSRPTIPHPGQLKNLRRLQEYMSYDSVSKETYQVQNAEKLKAMYSRIIDPEFLDWQ